MSPLTCDQVRDLLPAYVLGALERDEEAAVREHLAGCQLHAEAEELGGVVPYLAEVLDPVEPPVALKARIVAAAAADLEARRAAASRLAEAPRPVAPPVPTRAPAPEPERRPRFRFSWGLVLQAAAVLAVVVLGAWNLNLQSRIGTLETDIASSHQYERAIGDVLAAAVESGSKTVVLGPAEGFASTGLAAVRADGSIVLAMRGLDPTVGNEVYEAWVIVGEAAPLPIGSFIVAANGTGTFSSGATPAAAGAVVALTREPRPGATTPTLPIIALGTAIGPTS